MKNFVTVAALTVIGIAAVCCRPENGSIQQAKNAIENLKQMEVQYAKDPVIDSCAQAYVRMRKTGEGEYDLTIMKARFKQTRAMRQPLVTKIIAFRKQIPDDLSRKLDEDEMKIIAMADAIIAEQKI